ncbi:MAG TPA: ribonuclease J [Bacillota bacterium]
MREKPRQPKISLIPLGGLGEIGKNMLAVEIDEEILVIDAGLTFPEEEMLGIDIVIPDLSYLVDNAERVKGIILTHGHEDHIGALPYLLPRLNVPVYATKLTLGLVRGKIEEHAVELHPGSRVVKPGESVWVGGIKVDFFLVNHSIPDAVGLALHTPVGLVVHTGDFKFDQTPVDGRTADLHKLAELGDEGVLVLLSDSTGAERPGHTASERGVGRVLDDIFRVSKDRVLVATFASNVHRIQQVIDAAAREARKVAVTGRSLENVISIASELEYLETPPGVLVTIEEANRLPPERVVILTTGSQGEPLSALTRIANNDHRKVEIQRGDTVIIAATPIPGNEKMVGRTVDHLMRRGAQVVYGQGSGIHVSGHASREDLKLMLNLIRPKFFIPVHGEYRHMVRHAELAEEVGIPRDHIFVGDNGTIFEFTADRGRTAGKVTAGNVLVDGLGVGDVGTIVLRDRKQLAQDGILIVVLTIDRQNNLLAAGPDIVTRGFVYVRESEALIEEAKAKVREVLTQKAGTPIPEWSVIKANVREALGKLLYERTRRRPMILPIVMDV